jgi:hypothetical protein
LDPDWAERIVAGAAIRPGELSSILVPELAL